MRGREKVRARHGDKERRRMTKKRKRASGGGGEKERDYSVYTI